MINGVFCHESGCPEAWRDSVRECAECGDEFHPIDRYQRLCGDCLECNSWDDEDEYDDWEDEDDGDEAYCYDD